jgi:hypothetical protein
VGGEPASAHARDIVDYSSRSTRIVASTRSGGGARGEADTYRGVEGIRGGSGNDVLSGRFGIRDSLAGGRGNDRLRADDGRRDVVDCGADRDSYRADRKDRLKGCERRLR